MPKKQTPITRPAAHARRARRLRIAALPGWRGLACSRARTGDAWRWRAGGSATATAWSRSSPARSATASPPPASPPTACAKSASRDGPGAVRWRVGLRPDASLLQANYAVSRRVEELGGVVLSGRETVGPRGEMRLTLLLGLPKRGLHEVLLVRGVRPEAPSERPAPRLALVLFGFGDDLDEARRVFDLPRALRRRARAGRQDEQRDVPRGARKGPRGGAPHPARAGQLSAAQPGAGHVAGHD